ncbi:MAG: VOC family protein [Burkholderiaceae bacterium]
MIDHTGVVVSDFTKSKKFYAAALAANGARPVPATGIRPSRPLAAV